MAAGLAVLLISQSGWALPRIGGQEGDFLAWGAGGRALGLGKAYVALATDSSATYWNPAGLAWVDRAEVSALHAALWEGANYDSFGLALPSLSWANLGMFGTIVSIGGAERRDEENNVLAGTFGMTKLGVGAGLGVKVACGLALGVTGKYIGRWVDGVTSGFLTAELGLRWSAPALPWLAVGGVLQHVGTVTVGTTGDTLPRVARLGIVLTPNRSLWIGALSLDVEARLGSPVPVLWRMGVESVAFGPLTARIGMDTWEFSGGLGFTAGQNLRMDYSAARHADFGLSHRVSVALQWGPSMGSKRADLARTAYDRALQLYRAKSEDQETKAALRAALEDVLRYDAENDIARRLLDRLNGMRP